MAEIERYYPAQDRRAPIESFLLCRPSECSLRCSSAPAIKAPGLQVLTPHCQLRTSRSICRKAKSAQGHPKNWSKGGALL